MVQTGNVVTFLIYVAIMLLFGIYFFNRSKSLSDYILGGRKLNAWVASLSAQASDMSGWLLLGLPGYAYLIGVGASWLAIGLAVGTWLNWFFVAKRIRVYTEVAGDSLTISDFFEQRFNDNGPLLRIVSAIFILIFFLLYTASGFVASGKLFQTLFGFDYTLSILIGAIVVISYTFLGGFMAVCWTDLFQGILMFIAIILVPIVAIHSIGGYSVFESRIMAIKPDMFDLFMGEKGQSLSAITIVSLLAWGLGYFGQPHILARFMAIKKPKDVKVARRIAMVWVLVSLTAAVLVGMTGFIYLKEPLVGGDSEKVFMLLVDSLFHPVIAGILLAAILAAIMSTADSQLLVTASAVAEDFYKKIFRKNASDKELIVVSRITVVVVAILAFFLAISAEETVLDLVAYAWAGFGAVFGPIVLLSLYWRKMNGKAAFVGMLLSGITVLVWHNLSGGIFELYEIIPGFIVNLLCCLIGSLLGKGPSSKDLEQFTEMEKRLND